jgi:hypothetical protein
MDGLKNLKELTDEIKGAVEKNLELENRKKEVMDDLRKVMIKNYQTVLQEELSIYYRLSKDLREKFRCSVSYTEEKKDNSEIRLFYSYSDTDVYIKYYVDNSKYYLSLRGDDDTVRFLEKSGETTLSIFSEYLDTEEHALQLLERVRKGYSDIFTQFLAFINKENEKLHDSIEDLSKRLSDSSVVENKGDGTVEIHLGGKVFRGNIVEE